MGWATTGDVKAVTAIAQIVTDHTDGTREFDGRPRSRAIQVLDRGTRFWGPGPSQRLGRLSND